MEPFIDIAELAQIDSPLIFLTNDDGFAAAGIQALTKALSALGTVLVVAPEQDQSGVGRKITINRPLRLRRIAPLRYAVNGTPVDCVRLGLQLLGPNTRPRLVASGINHGPNLGGDVSYSGTIGACLDAQRMGLDGLAVSAGRDGQGGFAIQAAAERAAEQAASILTERDGGGIVWNLNVPHQVHGKTLAVPLDAGGFDTRIEQGTDPRGKDYFWIGPYHPKIGAGEATDMGRFYAGHATVTPLRPQLTDWHHLNQAPFGPGTTDAVARN